MNKNFDFTGKVAVVTGASTESGADAAMVYAKAGADVALLGNDIAKLNEVKAKIEEMGRKVVAVQCDGTTEASIKLAVKTVVDTFGKIDILFNNSNIAYQDGFEDMSDANWNKLVGGVFRSVFFTSKYVISHMEKRGYGKIVNVSSVNSRAMGKYGRWEVTPQEMISRLTKGLADIYSPLGISVNTIGTEKVNKDEFAETMLFLSCDKSGEVIGQLVDESYTKAIA